MPKLIGVAAIIPVLISDETSESLGAAMRRSDPVEKAAMDFAIAHERQHGWDVQDVHAKGRGYDLVSRGPDGQCATSK